MGAQSSIPAITGFVLSCPELHSSDKLVKSVNSQLVFLQPLGNLNPLGHNENYWFTSNCVTLITLITSVFKSFRQSEKTLLRVKRLVEQKCRQMCKSDLSIILLMCQTALAIWIRFYTPLFFL